MARPWMKRSLEQISNRSVIQIFPLWLWLYVRQPRRKSQRLCSESYLDELNRVCFLVDQERPYLSYEAIWAQFVGVEHNTDMLCLAIYLVVNLYVTYMLEKEGKKSIHRIGRAILFYAFDGAFDGLPAARVLLEGGADPNEDCEGKTPLVIMLTHCNMIKPGDTDIFRLMLKRGADSLEIVLRDDSGWWRAHEKPVDRTSAFHVALTQLEYLIESEKTEIIKVFLGHCKRFDAVDSKGFGIVEWADNCALFY